MRRRLTGAVSLAAAALVGVVLLGGCSSAGSGGDPGDGSTTTGAASTSGGPGVEGASNAVPSEGTSSSGPASAATAGLASGTATGNGSTSTQPCGVTVGSQLRERTTVTSGGDVAVLAGPLDCRSVGVWVSSFTLDQDPTEDPTPRFAGRYTGAQALSARLPAVAGHCSAAAVYFAVDADEAQQANRASTVAETVRSDLATWPGNQAATVPAAAILRGHASGVLVAAVAEDPSRCSPGENVATPQAAVGDCWLAGADPSGSGFRRSACTAAHTHEVYWAEGLTQRAYEQQAPDRRPPAAAWARQRAVDVCQARRTSLRLAPGVRQADIALELLWPSTLEYPPAAGSTSWSKAQVVCLARWQDGKATARRILRS